MMFLPNKNTFQETMDILQEECAEVIVEISKCRRFGMHTFHTKTNLEHVKMLENEIGDVLAMIDILVEQEILDPLKLLESAKNKKEKLKVWSTIYANDS